MFQYFAFTDDKKFVIIVDSKFKEEKETIKLIGKDGDINLVKFIIESYQEHYFSDKIVIQQFFRAIQSTTLENKILSNKEIIDYLSNQFPNFKKLLLLK